MEETDFALRNLDFTLHMQNLIFVQNVVLLLPLYQNAQKKVEDHLL